MAVGPVLSKMIVLVLLMLIGYFCSKLGITGPEFNRRANPVVINVFLVGTILNAVLSSQQRASGAVLAKYLGVSVLLFAVSMGVGFLAMRLIPVSKERKGILWCVTAFMNNAFVGFPVVEAVFGPEAVFFASISNLPFNFLLYTVAILMLQRGDGVKLELKKIVTAPLIATIAAAVLSVTGAKLPAPITETISVLGAATVPSSMIIIGTSLGGISAKAAFSDWRVYAASFFRLIVAPVLLWAVLRLMTGDPMLLGIPVLLMACPSAMIITVLCLQYGKDDAFSSQVIFVSTLLSALTIPALSAVLL